MIIVLDLETFFLCTSQPASMNAMPRLVPRGIQTEGDIKAEERKRRKLRSTSRFNARNSLSLPFLFPLSLSTGLQSLLRGVTEQLGISQTQCSAQPLEPSTLNSAGMEEPP